MPATADVAAGAPAPGSYSPREVRLIFAALLLGLLLAALDKTIVSTALPTIVGDLGGLSHISWVVTAYLLAATVSSAIYGKVGDLFGRKIVFRVAIVTTQANRALRALPPHARACAQARPASRALHVAPRATRRHTAPPGRVVLPRSRTAAPAVDQAVWRPSLRPRRQDR